MALVEFDKTGRLRSTVVVVSKTEQEVEFDRSTIEGRLAEMADLDSLSDEQVADLDLGHRYVTRNPAETPEQRAALLQRLTDSERRLAQFREEQGS